MAMDIFTELRRGYGGVLLYNLYSQLYPELLGGYRTNHRRLVRGGFARLHLFPGCGIY